MTMILDGRGGYPHDRILNIDYVVNAKEALVTEILASQCWDCPRYEWERRFISARDHMMSWSTVGE